MRGEVWSGWVSVRDVCTQDVCESELMHVWGVGGRTRNISHSFAGQPASTQRPEIPVTA